MRDRLARFIIAMMEPWSKEICTAFGIGAGVALGLLIAGGGTMF